MVSTVLSSRKPEKLRRCCSGAPEAVSRYVEIHFARKSGGNQSTGAANTGSRSYHPPRTLIASSSLGGMISRLAPAQTFPLIVLKAVRAEKTVWWKLGIEHNIVSVKTRFRHALNK